MFRSCVRFPLRTPLHALRAFSWSRVGRATRKKRQHLARYSLASRAMTVAVPIWQSRVSPVLDTASRLLVVCQDEARAPDRREIPLGALAGPEALARCVAGFGVDVLLCAAVSEPLRRALEREGVRVEGDLCGEVEVLLRAFHAGNWRDPEFRMPGSVERRACDPADRVAPLRQARRAR